MRDQARPLQKILIANRGEISLRIQRACAKLGIEAVAVYTIVDATAPFVLQAPHAVRLGDAPGSYLDGAKLLEVAIEQGLWGVVLRITSHDT
jgi:acetyl/propionyl-CoA carboxylase alpha subunit